MKTTTTTTTGLKVKSAIKAGGLRPRTTTAPASRSSPPSRPAACSPRITTAPASRSSPPSRPAACSPRITTAPASRSRPPIKAGGLRPQNHNRSGLKVKTAIKAGGLQPQNHNRSGLKVKSAIKAGPACDPESQPLWPQGQVRDQGRPRHASKSQPRGSWWPRRSRVTIDDRQLGGTIPEPSLNLEHFVSGCGLLVFTHGVSGKNSGALARAGGFPKRAS